MGQPSSDGDTCKPRANNVSPKERKHFSYQAAAATTSTNWAQPGFDNEDISAEEVSDEAGKGHGRWQRRRAYLPPKKEDAYIEVNGDDGSERTPSYFAERLT